MKDIVTLETALRLRDAGFPQPTPEFGQEWYNREYGLFVVGFIDAPYARATIIYNNRPSVFSKNIPNFSGCDFAPTATDILRELGPLFDLSCDCGEFWCRDEKDWNPAEAAAEAWLKLNPKTKKDFIRQTDEE